MALWRKTGQKNKFEREKQRELRKYDIVRENSFYTGVIGARPTAHLESATNLRAAKIYVPED